MTPPPAVLAPSVALPELPERFDSIGLGYDRTPVYTAEQMRDYARAARLARGGSHD